MDQEIRNKLRNVVTQCRKLLEDSVSRELEGKYGIFAKKDQVAADPNATMTHLTEEEQAARKDILDHFGHIKARGFKPKEALDQLIGWLEVASTGCLILEAPRPAGQARVSLIFSLPRLDARP